MSRNNTGNPIGSKAFPDFEDNVKNLDVAVNSNEATWTDRLGQSRRTLAGVDVAVAGVEDAATHAIDVEIPYQVSRVEPAAQLYFENAESDRAAEFNTAQTSREQQFAAFIASSGYQFSGDYAAGIEITQYNQLVRDENGEFWRVSGPTQLPYTTTGVGLPEGGAFVNVGDAAVRQAIQKGQLRSTNYTTDRTHRKSGVNSHSISLTSELIRPVVSFIDDDGASAFLTKLKPIFDSKGIKTALAVSTAGIGNVSWMMTWQEILDLYGEGYEIMSHSHNDKNMNTMDTSETEYELAQSRFELESRGIDVESFVYVEGAGGTDEQKQLVRKYYRSAYVTTLDGFQKKPLRDYTIARKNAVNKTVETNPTLQELKDLVDYAEANNEWVVFTTHVAYAGMDNTQLQVISDLIDYIQSKGIEILTPSKALDIHGSRLIVGTPDSDDVEPAEGDERYTIVDKYGEVFPKNVRVFGVNHFDSATPLDDYPKNSLTVFRATGSAANPFPGIGGSVRGLVETFSFNYYSPSLFRDGYQRLTLSDGRVFIRHKFQAEVGWRDWEEQQRSIVGGYSSNFNKPLSESLSSSVLNIEVSLANSAGLNTPSRGMVMTTGRAASGGYNGFQDHVSSETNASYRRVWNWSTQAWSPWQRLDEVKRINVDEANNAPSSYQPLLRYATFNVPAAQAAGMPGNAAGTLFWYVGAPVADSWSNHQIYQRFRSNIRHMRYWDDTANGGVGEWSPWVRIAGGATGTFTTADSKTVTVENGIITDIS